VPIEPKVTTTTSPTYAPMKKHYPRIRIHAESGPLLIREGLNLTFYMRHPHAELAPSVMRALDAYLRAVGPDALDSYSDEDGCWQRLDEAGWALTRDRLLNPRRASIHLSDASSGEHRYRFDYQGRRLGAPFLADEPGAVSAVSFWLPTEYLEEHGPVRVRELALELAAPLSFCSGHAGLSFNCEPDLVGVEREVLNRCFRYPGLDIPDLDRHSWKIGTRLRGPAWMTFLGQPVLDQLGGAAGLRSRLCSPETTVQELEGERVVITLGPWPEAGDPEQGDTLPTYRELARLLEPWLYREEALRGSDFTPEELRRWERRFLD